MKNESHTLFIVDDNPLVITDVRNFLHTKFGSTLRIFTFHNGESALKKVNLETNIVILDYNLEGENGNKILKSIKEINPNTEVIMYSSNKDIGIAIEAFRNGAKDFVVKGYQSRKKLTSVILQILTYPIRIMVREFGISKFLAIFLMSFITMGLVVSLVLKYYY